MGEHTVHQRRGHLATILLFVVLQSVGTQIGSVILVNLLLDMQKFIECQGSEPQPQSNPEVLGPNPCETLAIDKLLSSQQVYGRIEILFSLGMSIPLARYMDVMGPGKRGLVMAASATFMALGDIWLYICGGSSWSEYSGLPLTVVVGG